MAHPKGQAQRGGGSRWEPTDGGREREREETGALAGDEDLEAGGEHGGDGSSRSRRSTRRRHLSELVHIELTAGARG